MKDNHLMRIKDITMILGMIGIASYLVVIARHSSMWDRTAERIEIIDTVVNTHTVAVAVITQQLIDIKKDLEEIKKNTK